MEADADSRAYDALAEHPRIADLGAVARAVIMGAAEARRPERNPERVAQLAGEHNVSRDDATTPFGNALDVLGRDPEDGAERALACALAAHALLVSPPKGADEESRLAADVLWLATHTPFDTTNLLDRALSDDAANMWGAIADRIRRIEQGSAPTLGRGEALIGAVALASSRSKSAGKEALALAADVRDKKIARALSVSASIDAFAPIQGELAPAPRGPVATVLLAFTGLLFLAHVARLAGRIALGYKRPAEIALSEDGSIRVKWRAELLGRTLHDRDVVVPRASLVRAMRDVRYRGIALYAGLLSLAVGSYVGVTALVDGARAASPSLLASGLVIVAVGIALDFVLSSVAPGARGRCRLVVVPRDGRPLCIGGIEAKRADELLARLSRPT
jgi:hypothetical protein